MDDLSDISINFDSKLSSLPLDELYTSIDNDLSDCANNADMSRPSSTLSFASWTFSPIAEDYNKDSQHEEVDQKAVPEHSHPNQVKTCVPVHVQSCVPVQSQSCTPVQSQGCVPVQNQTQSMGQHEYPAPSCEFVYPNSITYHQSVNIHNYIGNYCLGSQVWKPEYVPWDRPVPSHTPFLDRPETPIAENSIDPVANLNNASLEFTRCSTPEYLMALNSLNQLDSPPRPNLSAAINFNCAASFEESMNKSIKQDSGYSSDLNASPVIQIQEGNVKLLRAKQTSTPQPPTIMRVPNTHFNKENVAPSSHMLASPNFQTAMPGLHRFQNVDTASKNVLIQSNGYLQSTLQKPANVSQSTVQKPANISQSTQQKPGNISLKTEQTFKTMADYQIAKKAKAESLKAVKRKSESELPESDPKRRRHNEPLNNTALTVMTDWYESHLGNPYPTKAEKEDLAKRGGISVCQVKSWFANKRNRSNNTRPKKHKKEMEGRLLDICHQLARDASKPSKDNAYYIQQLSSILDKTKYY